MPAPRVDPLILKPVIKHPDRLTKWSLVLAVNAPRVDCLSYFHEPVLNESACDRIRDKLTRFLHDFLSVRENDVRMRNAVDTIEAVVSYAHTIDRSDGGSIVHDYLPTKAGIKAFCEAWGSQRNMDAAQQDKLKTAMLAHLQSLPDTVRLTPKSPLAAPIIDL